MEEESDVEEPRVIEDNRKFTDSDTKKNLMLKLENIRW